MGNIPSLDRKKMKTVKTAFNDEVNHETIFHFKESDGIITAEYDKWKSQKWLSNRKNHRRKTSLSIRSST